MINELAEENSRLWQNFSGFSDNLGRTTGPVLRYWNTVGLQIPLSVQWFDLIIKTKNRARKKTLKIL
jgi:hypothetical protein